MPPPVPLAEGAAVSEEGYYVVEVATRRLWRLDAPISWSPDGKSLASGKCGDWTGGLDIIDLVAGSAIRLVSGCIGATAWSPKATQIAFSKMELLVGPGGSSATVMFVVNRDGSGLRQLSGAIDISRIRWSPRGERIAFQSGGVIYVLHLASGAIGKISGIGGPVGFAWSPDGRSIALGGSHGVYLYDVETGSLRQVVSGPFEGRTSIPHVQWSPDGSKIFARESTASFFEDRFLVIDLEGSREPWPLPAARSAAWSPDGRWIAYLEEGCLTRAWDIYLITPDGTSTKRLTSTPQAIKEGPFWSPKGSLIAFSTKEGVMIVDAESGESRTLVRREEDNTFIHLHVSPWSPDGRYMAFPAGGGHGLCD